jgi:hypothetical protein
VTVETTTQRRRLTEPLESVAWFYLTLMAIALLGGIGFTVFGSGSIGGIGHDADVCATRPYTTYNSSDWTLPPGMGLHARPGSQLMINGTAQLCADHPDFGQRVLYTLTDLPTFLVWAGVLLLVWQMIRAARREGPFTPRVAVVMRRLGWFILGGSLIAGLIQHLSIDGLLVTMARTSSPFVSSIFGPLRALVPVPLLAGAALLSFARIIRLGAEMDDEIKGTV